ncbi:MAG: DEAD/DEAH box helicase [Caldilinea sp.]
MTFDPQNPLIVQGDKSVLLEVDSPHYQDARDVLARFAELEKSPEYIHTYRISPLSLWNAAASGLSAPAIIGGLERFAKYPIPGNVRVDITEAITRYGRVKLIKRDNQLLMTSEDASLLIELQRRKELQPYILGVIDTHTLCVDAAMRGHIKQALVNVGYPAQDLAGYVQGETLLISLRPQTTDGHDFTLRNYQSEAAAVYYAGGADHGGSGVVVLPCGAGKTMVGMAAMAMDASSTLILTPNSISVEQWIKELLDKTTLEPEQIGEYTGQRKEIRPVTVATYQTITYRRRSKDRNANGGLRSDYPHFDLFDSRNWGLIIYDEVHLLPAPVFSITAELQARRRLGLTATLVREDGRESEVFSLIGPKKYDVPWKDLERQGWIATADCIEVRIPLPDDARMEYALADQRHKYRLSASSPAKLDVLDRLLIKHLDEQVLIIGMYLDQLAQVQQRYGFPMITGETPARQRSKLYHSFRSGEIKQLIISKVGNFAMDLPDASVMVQLSGTFGSRQEEAQRLGRILRPKRDGQMAHFYTLVSRDTQDQEFSANRQLFLTEQGYQYIILYDDEIADYEPRRQANELVD